MDAELSEREKYVCQVCGVADVEFTGLCHPAHPDAEKKFCGANALRVCNDKKNSMKFQCDACNSVSADPDRLCSPSEIR